MKSKLYIGLTLIILFGANISLSAEINESNIKSTLTKIFNLCDKQNYSAAAPLLLNKSKSIKAYNFKNKKESKSVKRICKKIKAYLDLSDSYEYKAISYGTLKKLPSSTLKVNFKSGNQELSISFVFVELKGKILLASFK